MGQPLNLIFRYHECHFFKGRAFKIDISNRSNRVVLLTQTGQSTKYGMAE